MKSLEVKTSTNETFIGAYDIENNKLCEDLIIFFENNKELQKHGRVAGGVDTKIKKTTDITIYPYQLKDEKFSIFNEYFNLLKQCYEIYKETYPFLKTFANQMTVGSFNLQKYNAGDHFARLHSERTSLDNIHRLFAWMTYLNDVEDGGTTNFNYFDIKIKPKIGKTLIWPAEWTHAHTGDLLKEGKKYIITGWIQFFNKNDK